MALVVRPRYVQSFKDRHGRTRYYLRRRGHPVIPLPDAADPGFLAAYQLAFASTTKQPTSRTIPGSVMALAESYKRSGDFRRLGATTRRVYERIIVSVVDQHGSKPVSSLSQAAVRQLIADKAATPAAANHLLRTLRAMMRHAVETGFRTTDPTQGVRREREKGQGAEIWSEADVQAFESHWPPGSKPRLALALLLYTGQRRSDVVRMGPADVSGNSLAVAQVKTGTRLILPIRPELAVLLPTGGGETFLRTEGGNSFSPNGFYMRFRGWCEAAGLPAGHSPHGLRKAAARRLAEAGCSAHEIAAITGHKTLAEVQRYTKAVHQEALARQAFARVMSNPSVKPSPERP